MYKRGEGSYASIAEIASVDTKSLQAWVRNYVTFGIEIFSRRSHQPYSAELKANAVQDYLAGAGSLDYRRLRDKIARDYHIHVNDKRILRICRKKKICSVIKGRHNCCTRSAIDPYYTTENVLSRDFCARQYNQKWVTDITEFKYYTENGCVKELYLSTIPDLYDRRLVSYVIGDSNNNQLVFQTFDLALEANPGARPIFHSDRGFQHTNKAFRAKLEQAGMTQSMSRVAHCLDNAPMECSLGILKHEMYYRRKFTSRQELAEAIEEYIRYYNYDRPQRRLGILTPNEYHEKLVVAA